MLRGMQCVRVNPIGANTLNDDKITCARKQGAKIYEDKPEYSQRMITRDNEMRFDACSLFNVFQRIKCPVAHTWRSAIVVCKTVNVSNSVGILWHWSFLHTNLKG